MREGILPSLYIKLYIKLYLGSILVTNKVELCMTM